MKKITFQRDKLYLKVWSKPISRLAEELGISSHNLYKVCDELHITPSTGYWSKLRHGKQVKKPELPQSDNDSFTLILPDGESNKLVKSTEKITVRKRLTNPHRLIVQARKNIDKTHLNQFNRIRGGDPLDISVGPNNVERSLRILDSLLKEIEKRGYGLRTYRENNSYWMLIKKDKDEVYFQLREKGSRIKISDKDQRWPEYSYTPTGELQLVLFRETYDRTGKVLSDTQTQTLEERLDEFFIKLETVVDQVRKRRLKIEEYHRQQKKARKIEKASKEQHEEEVQRQRKLEMRAQSFTTSQYIYDFIDEIEKQQAKLDLNEEDEMKFKAWIIWAKNHADRLNPIKKMMNEIIE
jgi:hypothetical protein